jgi:GT2 family glycosyltransferase
MAVPITIVIPCRNSSRTIDACLRSVLDAAPANEREVIVVDNGSSDGTVEIIRRYPVRLEQIPAGFVSRSRNVGARLATHPIVAFVDSDCAVGEGWHAAVGRALTDSTVGVVGLRHDAPVNGTWVQRAWTRAHSRAQAARESHDVPYVPAGNMALPAAVFAKANGFDETLETGEDPDLCARVAALGHRVIEARAMRCVHFGEPATLLAVFRRERWHGRGVRLRYGDGRLAPITVATGVFAATALLAVLTTALAFVSGRWLLPATLGALALAIPAVHTIRYAKDRVHAVQLWPIYLAYFGGRAASLGIVLRRAWNRRSDAPTGPRATGSHASSSAVSDERPLR